MLKLLMLIPTSNMLFSYYYKPEYFSDMIDAYSPLAIGMLAFSLGMLELDVSPFI